MLAPNILWYRPCKIYANGKSGIGTSLKFLHRRMINSQSWVPLLSLYIPHAGQVPIADTLRHIMPLPIVRMNVVCIYDDFKT